MKGRKLLEQKSLAVTASSFLFIVDSKGGIWFDFNDEISCVER